MPLVTVNALNPDPAVIERAAALLRNGGLVAFPTETVYGLGANLLDDVAVARIFEAKGRPAWNPVIAHVANQDQARGLVSHWPERATALADAFWPGPLTLVLPKRDVVPDIATAGLSAIGIRVPSHVVALALINALKLAIAAPSANRFTELSPTTAQHVQLGLGDRVDLILDGGPSEVGIESTVIDLTGDMPTLLRPGVIGRDALERVLRTRVAAPLSASDEDNAPRLSPGRVLRHYSPRAHVWLFDADDVDNVSNAVQDYLMTNLSGRVAALVIDWSLALPANVRVVRMPRDPGAYARLLYSTLHELDANGINVIVVEQPPDMAAWTGVRDRLTRGAKQ